MLNFEYVESVRPHSVRYKDLPSIQSQINKLIESGNRYLAISGFEGNVMAYQSKLWYWQDKCLIPGRNEIAIHREGGTHIVVENLNWRKDT